MTRPVELGRDDAEMLDELLEAYFAKSGDMRALWLAEELWKIWGMTPWDRRPQQEEKQ